MWYGVVRAAAGVRAHAEPVWCRSCYKCFSNFLSAPDSSSTVSTKNQQNCRNMMEQI